MARRKGAVEAMVRLIAILGFAVSLQQAAAEGKNCSFTLVFDEDLWFRLVMEMEEGRDSSIYPMTDGTQFMGIAGMCL